MTIFDKYDDLVKLATRIAGADGLELAHDTLEKVMSYSEEHQERILKDFERYFKVVLWRSYHARNGSYRRKNDPVKTFDRELSEGLDDSVILREFLDQQYRSMPKIDRVIFDARFNQGLTTREVARCAGWDVRKTRKRIQLIKESIKHGIAKECLSC